MAWDVTSALREARPEALWLDRPERPDAGRPLCGGLRPDLVIVGAGFTGLWAAVRAKERRPDLDVVVIDAARIAHHATGRNGGFCSSSLTHGLDNGVERFPDEIGDIEELAAANFAGIEATIERYGIECDWWNQGAINVATQPHQLDDLMESAEIHRRHGIEVESWDTDRIRAEIASPTYLGAVFQPEGEALVDPAKLAWGLAEVARSLGVEVLERTEMLGVDERLGVMEVRTSSGTMRCDSVILATNAHRSPISAINRRTVPVYDYVLATEPLDAAQRDAIGWSRRAGVSDSANQFHYYRMTADHRIVWGGYDAIYHFGSRVDPSLDQRADTHEMLAQHFFETFPQLEGLAFSHRWGGVIDTCSRFSVWFGSDFGGRLVYAVGYTGLGVGASRFGADVCLDMLYEPDSPALRLKMVRSKPLPFPPEPLRWVGIEMTRRGLAKADANAGRRGPWLRALDAVGLGFDS